jgi:hypothetical protein
MIPKKIYYNRGMGEAGEDRTSEKEISYISVEALREWIEDNYLRFSTMNDVIAFKKFINKE